MIPHTSEDGLLSPGIQSASLNDFAGSFGHTDHRRKLLDGLGAAMMNLKNAGCQTTYVNGSFAIGKEVPGDFGDCWEEAGIDPTILDPVLLTFENGRAAQKAKYQGELFPESVIANAEGFSFLEFFQMDKETGRRKGIVALDLGELG